MDKLSKEEVLHVAKLARLGLSEEEIDDYAYKLKEIMNSIEKIKEVDTVEERMLITPCNQNCVVSTDVACEGLSKEEILRNVPNKKDRYIVAKGVFDEN